MFLGYFSDDREAARMYDAKAIELFGEFANINGVSDSDPEPELTTPTSDYEEFTVESGDVEEDAD